MLDPVEDERQRQEYEAQQGYEAQRELERYKKAVQMCIAAGHLPQKKWDQAMEFVKQFHS